MRDHVGEAWYETTVRIPARWAGERTVLRLGAATHRAVVWVDGTQVARRGRIHAVRGRHQRHRRAGAEHRVVVAVDNVLSWQSIPPGYVEEMPAGPRQRYFHDFFNYAGLHRSVWLYTTPRAHVADVTVLTGLDGSIGTVRYEVDREGGGDLEVRVALRDAEGAEVARATGSSGELTIITPAQATRFEWLASATDRARVGRRAAPRLLGELAEMESETAGAIGADDPLRAFEDAIHEFPTTF